MAGFGTSWGLCHPAHDYRKARTTPLDWPAYKWPSVTELAADQEAALAGQDAQGVDLTRVPDGLRKWAKDETVLGAETLINGRAALKGDSGLWCVDGRIWIPAARLDLHARLCVVAHAGSACHRGRDAAYADLRVVVLLAPTAPLGSRLRRALHPLPRDDTVGPPDRAPARGDTARDGQILMFDFVLVVGRRKEKKAPQPTPAVNAVKAVKAKAKAAASNTKTKATKTKVNKAAAAHEQSYTHCAPSHFPAPPPLATLAAIACFGTYLALSVRDSMLPSLLCRSCSRSSCVGLRRSSTSTCSSRPAAAREPRYFYMSMAASSPSRRVLRSRYRRWLSSPRRHAGRQAGGLAGRQAGRQAEGRAEGRAQHSSGGRVQAAWQAAS